MRTTINEFDVRVTELATGRVTNYFDFTLDEVSALSEALHPDLYSVKSWHPLLSDGPVHPDEFHGSVAEYEESGFDSNCLACTDSERYDDHMHPDELDEEALYMKERYIEPPF